eukprot:scaffold1470_cov384-Prasinococcus_capsulatus_cf.AAC.6
MAGSSTRAHSHRLPHRRAAVAHANIVAAAPNGTPQQSGECPGAAPRRGVPSGCALTSRASKQVHV